MRNLGNFLVVFGSVGIFTVEAQSYYDYNSSYTSYTTYDNTLVYVGAIIGVVVCIAIVIIVVVCVCCRRHHGAAGTVIHSNPSNVVFSTSQHGQHAIHYQRPAFYQSQQSTSQLQLLSPGFHTHQPFQQSTGNLRPLQMLNRVTSSAQSLPDMSTLQDFGSFLQDSFTGADSLMSCSEAIL
ncbi:uncharacterized protein LOC134270751 [Saccostrea cucullata]|uniref:uncharacterized protein LOC134270751 n=1 Tax=Saccostrea cuccullata TaxID=36930 RepID=UPI002ED18139